MPFICLRSPEGSRADPAELHIAKNGQLGASISTKQSVEACIWGVIESYWDMSEERARGRHHPERGGWGE